MCSVAAVKSLPVHNHSAGHILFPLGSLSPTIVILKNRIPLRPALGAGAYAVSQTTVLQMKRLNHYENTPIQIY